MATLPDFTDDGLLPPGDYPLTPDDLIHSQLIAGPKDRTNCPNWNEPWRRYLVANLGVLVGQLAQVGIVEVFVDGSFVEDKERPNDIDGYFVCPLRRLASGELERSLNLLDPFKVWTWDPASRRPAPGFTKAQLPMWHQYRVELYPHVGSPCGIRDEHGNDLEFPAAFRKRRGDRKAKGIVKLLAQHGGTP